MSNTSIIISTLEHFQKLVDGFNSMPFKPINVLYTLFIPGEDFIYLLGELQGMGLRLYFTPLHDEVKVVNFEYHGYRFQIANKDEQKKLQGFRPFGNKGKDVVINCTIHINKIIDEGNLLYRLYPIMDEDQDLFETDFGLDY